MYLTQLILLLSLSLGHSIAPAPPFGPWIEPDQPHFVLKTEKDRHGIVNCYIKLNGVCGCSDTGWISKGPCGNALKQRYGAAGVACSGTVYMGISPGPKYLTLGYFNRNPGTGKPCEKHCKLVSYKGDGGCFDRGWKD